MGETARDLSAMPRMKRRRTGLSRGGRDDGDVERAGGIIDGGDSLIDFAKIGIAGDGPETARSFKSQPRRITDRCRRVPSPRDIHIRLQDVRKRAAHERVVGAGEAVGANLPLFEQVVSP